MNKELQNLPCEERQKELGLFMEGYREPYCTISVLEGHLQRAQSLSLHKEQHGQTKGQWVLETFI